MYINQEDIQERNAQVALMSSIYLQCHRLIIDVGGASRTRDAALDLIKEYHRQREAGEPDRQYEYRAGLYTRDMVNEFYAHSWFSRV